MSEFYGGFSDEEQPRNETPLMPVDESFKNILTGCKRSIYAGIVFAQPEDSAAAQDPRLLDEYLRSLSALYGIMNSLPNLPVENIDWSTKPWDAIPGAARGETQAAVLWYKNYLQKNNKPGDKIQYTHYISNVLHVHPYTQLPNPEED